MKMSKGQKRSGREAKKPKKEKVTATPVTVSSMPQVKLEAFSRGTKKR
jgi:hypothetical protein